MRKVVLIGAPEAQTRQPGVTKGGAVYRCETSRDDACEEILFDSTGNNNNTDGRQIDKKSNQWFGATVRSSGETGIVLTHHSHVPHHFVKYYLGRFDLIAAHEFIPFNLYGPFGR
ncbi:hypothetical protein RUM43_014117 [Polyplax serrata]|uniref:Uncharacterized protein n=1 Tax=Polyplax serrata TaxID=468196 RepID=A0AAN8NJD2_POLSC